LNVQVLVGLARAQFPTIEKDVKLPRQLIKTYDRNAHKAKRKTSRKSAWDPTLSDPFTEDALD